MIRLLTFVAVAVFWVMAITQIIVPVCRGRPVFPMFSRRRRIEKAIIKEHAYADEDQLSAELDRLRSKREPEAETPHTTQNKTTKTKPQNKKSYGTK